MIWENRFFSGTGSTKLLSTASADVRSNPFTPIFRIDATRVGIGHSRNRLGSIRSSIRELPHYFQSKVVHMTLSHSDLINFPVIESCAGCGACCLQTAVPPYVLIDGVHEAIVRQVPEELIREIMPFWEIRFKLDEQTCPWFDTQSKGCRHYEHRPQACRDFEINSAFCHAIRDRWEIEC